ncbi:armadillo-type protein [Lipomyces oligophaga]|uniref:armadillo-type protein n=1 Tax=Lipomyces oligophaga TaxID=45792 RepID=UPI0034CEBE16
MEKLLKWSLENSESTGIAEEDRRQPTPNAEVLGQLFGQPSDAQLMQESMAIIQSESASLDDRESAFDNLEMLVENLDNANNLEPMGMWPGLLSQLQSPEPVIRKMACWVIGTAVQNNPKSQAALAAYPNAVPDLLAIANGDKSKDCRLKAMYCLSSAIRNHQPGYEAFRNAQGWKVLVNLIRGRAFVDQELDNTDKSLDEVDTEIRQRSIFLLAGILSTEPLSDKIEMLRTLSAIPDLLTLLHVEQSYSAIEKIVQVLLMIAKSDAGFTDDERAQIKAGLERAKRDELLDMDLTDHPSEELTAEWRQLERAIQ